MKDTFTIELLHRMSVFAAVVEHQSMTAAAKALGVSTSAVSQQVRQLERESGVTLLLRSTRQLRLSSAGEEFYQYCAAMLAAARGAKLHLMSQREEPTGQLRLSAPVGFARHVAPALSDMLVQHQGLSLSMNIQDTHIDLVASQIDLAIRFGSMPDSSWVARRLCSFEWVICASAEWLAAHGPVHQPDDLLMRQWITFDFESDDLVMDLKGPQGESRVVSIRPRIRSNNQLSLQQMCAAGMGLARLTRVDAAAQLECGALVQVLPDWSQPGLDVWAVTPQRDGQSAKVRFAMEAIQRHLTGLQGVYH